MNIFIRIMQVFGVAGLLFVVGCIESTDRGSAVETLPSEEASVSEPAFSAPQSSDSISSEIEPKLSDENNEAAETESNVENSEADVIRKKLIAIVYALADAVEASASEQELVKLRDQQAELLQQFQELKLSPTETAEVLQRHQIEFDASNKRLVDAAKARAQKDMKVALEKAAAAKAAEVKEAEKADAVDNEAADNEDEGNEPADNEDAGDDATATDDDSEENPEN